MGIYNADSTKPFDDHLDEIIPRWPPTNNVQTYANITVRSLVPPYYSQVVILDCTSIIPNETNILFAGIISFDGNLEEVNKQKLQRRRPESVMPLCVFVLHYIVCKVCIALCQ